MDDNLKKILEALPDKPPRSRLEPYRDFIEELRRRDRTFREIAEILAEKCQVKVTGSGIHDFLRARSRLEVKPSSAKFASVSVALPADSPSPRAASYDEVQRRIAALKAHNPSAHQNEKGFEYDPDEPLRLKRSR